MSEKPKGMLVLEDGSTFVGDSLGASGEWFGEVVFDTGLTGYQEVITDPSCYGQMVVFTCPHIGNVGVNWEDGESDRPYVQAVLARKICEYPSNWRCQQSLPDFLRAHGVPALSGLDTRRLTLILRDKGVMRGALSTVNLDRDYLLEKARSAPDMSERDVVEYVMVTEPKEWTESIVAAWKPMLAEDPPPNASRPHVVVVDCGTKHSILRNLVYLGARVTLVPVTFTADEILAYNPDGVLYANGPGDPRRVPTAIASARALIGRVPLFGICLGHQVIGLACGARYYKLSFGHHGDNHPVRDVITGRVMITTQSHNYAIDEKSLEGLPLEVTHVNLYDGTIEGLRHKELPVASVQFHPEASPGPHDSLYILRNVVDSFRKQ